MSRTYNISKPGDDGKRFVIGLRHRIWVGTLRSRNTFAQGTPDHDRINERHLQATPALSELRSRFEFSSVD